MLQTEGERNRRKPSSACPHLLVEVVFLGAMSVRSVFYLEIKTTLLEVENIGDFSCTTQGHTRDLSVQPRQDIPGQRRTLTILRQQNLDRA
jgi:hypothetical protein